MSTIPPEVREEIAAELASSELGLPVSDLRPLEGGQIARSFSFSAGGRPYVLQFNRDNMDANFEKSAFVARTFGSKAIPIPEVVRFGRFGDLHFCITRKASGRQFGSLTPEEQSRSLPALLDTLDAIHAVDVRDRTGYGLFDGSGRGMSASWPGYLSSVADEERADGFYGRWHHLFTDGSLDREMFDRVFARMRELLPACPGERWLVHGGFGGRNLLIENDEVSAVLDWIDARYGDFVYDLAGLDFWEEGRGYRALLRERYVARGIEIPHYEARMLCHQCYQALDAFRFFAKSGRADALRWTRDRIFTLMESGEGA